MPFEYQPYHSDLSGTIADLMTRGDRARADAARRSGDAQARSAELQGQHAADLGRNLGQIATGVTGQIVQHYQDEPRRKMEALQLSEQQRAVSARDAFAKIIKDTPQMDEDGVSLYDIPAVARQLAAAGQDPSAAVQHLSGLNDAFRAEKAAKLALVKRGAESIIAAGNDPVLAGHFLDQLEKNKTYSTEQIDQFRAFIQADPANVAKVTAMLMGPQKLENAAPGSVSKDQFGRIVPGSQVPDRPTAPSAAALAMDAANPNSPTQAQSAAALKLMQAPAPKGLQSKSVLVDGKPVEAVFDPATGRFTVGGQDVTDRARPIPPASAQAAAAGGGLDEGGLDYAATQYRITGKMPALGMGKDQDRKKIINLAAQQAKELKQTPAIAIQRQAAFKADGAALTKMTQMSSAAEAYESKALAQADIVSELSDKVNRSKWPVVNAAYLAGKTEILGDKDASMLLNAITTFTSEYSKILEGATGSAAGSSDSARAAAAKLLSAKMGKGTVEGVLTLMKREMRNTVLGYDVVKQHITDRMGGTVPASPGKTNDPLGIR